MKAIHGPRQSVSVTTTLIAPVAVLLMVAPSSLAQLPNDANRVSLEVKIVALQPLACAAPGAPADPQVATLKTVLDAYTAQYNAVLAAQIAALNGHAVPNLSTDDQDMIAAARARKKAALADVCAASAIALFAPPVGGAAKAAAPPASLADKLDVTPSVVRASDQAVEVSEQAVTSVTVKNNNDGEVRLGVAQVCLEDTSGCHPQGEVFQVADGVDKCKNPLANKDQCTLKILFTPHRSYSYNQWLQLPLVDGGGQPLKKADGTPEAPLMIPLQGKGFVADMARVETTKANANNPALRSVVGLDIGGATSTDTQQKLFVDFALSAPIGWSGFTVCSNTQGEPMTDRHGSVLKTAPAVLLGKVPAGTVIGGDKAYDLCQELRSPEEKANKVRYIWKDRRTDPLESRAWWFFNPRITSIPQPASALSSLNVQGFTDIFSSKQTNIVQGVDVQGGLEVMIVKPRVGRAFYGSFKNTKARLGLAWVFGAGFASPFAAPGTNPTVFTLDPKSPLRHQFQASGTQFCGTSPGASPCDIPSSFTNITFVNLERSRFFRKYYTGLRMKTYHFSKSYQSYDCNPGYKNECEGVYNAYPGILDLTVGQDEQVTGGHLSRWLLRLDVSYPLPFLPGTYAFGGVNSAFKKNQNSDPVFLPATSTTAINDPSVFQVKVPLRDRDTYRLGIGVDILQVITQAKQGSNKNPAGAGTTPTTQTPPPADKTKQN
jgi:hypothetical protein